MDSILTAIRARLIPEGILSGYPFSNNLVSSATKTMNMNFHLRKNSLTC